MAKADLTAQQVRELLNYCPESGLLTWVADRCKGARIKAGTEAGTLCKRTGYRKVNLFCTPRLSHRLAWLHYYGEPPLHFIDHINGVRDDNRIENLRQATNAENLQNMREAKSNNKHSGVLGVYRNRKKWTAHIKANGRVLCLGSYETIEDAQAAYIAKKRELHPFGML